MIGAKRKKVRTSSSSIAAMKAKIGIEVARRVVEICPPAFASVFDRNLAAHNVKMLRNSNLQLSTLAVGCSQFKTRSAARQNNRQLTGAFRSDGTCVALT